MQNTLKSMISDRALSCALIFNALMCIACYALTFVCILHFSAFPHFTTATAGTLNLGDRAPESSVVSSWKVKS